MALGDAYMTAAQFRARTRETSSANDTAIDAVLLSASRSVDGWCGREFNKSAVADARLFDTRCYGAGWDRPLRFTHEWPSGGWCRPLTLGDVVSIESIAGDDGSGTFPDVWDPDSYVLVPRNASAKGFPYASIEPSGLSGGWMFGSWPIRVTAVWGWPAVPAPVKEATFLIANRLKSLWDAPFGMSGGGEMGSLDMTVSITPIIAGMLAPYKVRPA